MQYTNCNSNNNRRKVFLLSFYDISTHNHVWRYMFVRLSSLSFLVLFAPLSLLLVWFGSVMSISLHIQCIYTYTYLGCWLLVVLYVGVATFISYTLFVLDNCMMMSQQLWQPIHPSYCIHIIYTGYSITQFKKTENFSSIEKLTLSYRRIDSVSEFSA